MADNTMHERQTMVNETTDRKTKRGEEGPHQEKTGANSGAMLTVVHYRKVHCVAITLLTFISQFTDRLRLEINTS